MQYRRYNVSKHEKDRLTREAWNARVNKLIAEAIAERDAWIQERTRQVELLNDLGNGCYWHHKLMGAE